LEETISVREKDLYDTEDSIPVRQNTDANNLADALSNQSLEAVYEVFESRQAAEPPGSLSEELVEGTSPRKHTQQRMTTGGRKPRKVFP